MSKFHMREVDDLTKWDAFVEFSPQGTIFSSYTYLEAVDRKYKLYWIYKGNQVKAGLSLILSDDESRCELDDLVIYNGILFGRDQERKETKASFERFELTEFVIEELDHRFKSIELTFSPHFEDMRPFLWHNYNSENQDDKFKVDLRYTSYLDISSLTEGCMEEKTTVFHRMEPLRQRNIREARKKGSTSVIERKSERFVDFYDKLMSKQGERVSQKKLRRMHRLIEVLLNKQQAMMVVSRNAAGKLLYITIFCIDRKRAYYLFGAGNPEAREHYKGTICFWEAFRFLCNDYEIIQVDMEGVNSPQRGWFKLSFGGDLRPYYQVTKSVRI